MGRGGHDDWVLNLTRALRGRDRGHIREVAAAARAAGVPDEVVRALHDLSRPATIPQPIATPLRRFARGLQIPLFEVVGGQVAPLTSVAERKLGVGFPGDAADAVERLTGHPAEDPLIGECLAMARDEGEGSCTLENGADRWRLHATYAVRGLQVAVVSQATTHAGELEVLATVNHEMANGLTAMTSLAARAQLPGTTPEQTAEALRRIEEAAIATLRSVRGTRRALRHRTGSDSPAAADLGPLLADLIDGFAAVASRRGVRLARDIGDDLLAAASPGDLRSIVWNLMKNAIEAVDDGGNVRVTAAGEDRRVRIVVEDDGPGMEPSTRERLFEPYFTTKDEGSGLGLPLVRHLTHRLGGELEVDSAPGEGTRFVVLLPRVQTVADLAAPAISAMRPPAIAPRAVLVGRGAEGLDTALRANRVELETLAGVLGNHVQVDWAFVDPGAASFASAIRAAAGQVVWMGARPAEADEDDALGPETSDIEGVARWLLAHPRPTSGAAARRTGE